MAYFFKGAEELHFQNSMFIPQRPWGLLLLSVRTVLYQHIQKLGHYINYGPNFRHLVLSADEDFSTHILADCSIIWFCYF